MANRQLQDSPGRVHWRSRRGMLEVEIELVPFARERFDSLAAADKEAYGRLLEEDDWTLNDWLRGLSHPDDPALKRVVGLIREASRGAGNRGHNR